jgi:HD-GYP domain-containing protein (c-di-GMP phosphodiesterase class II)
MRETRYPPELTRPIFDRDEPLQLTRDDLREAGFEGPVETPGNIAIAPVRIDGGRLAAIAVAAPDDEPVFSDRKLRLLAGLAHQSQLAITNAGNFESLERTFLSTVEALANALEASDEHMSSHARWITDLAVRLGAEMGLDQRALKRLELGALFHDIGKLGIPETILSKPAPLDPHEQALLELHPELGEKILAPIERLEEVRPIVRHCHERWDGDGYPDGLKGEEIPIESRIIFVCDAFHAMTTDRPYRRRLATEEACRRLAEGAGSQFDPHVIDVCLALFVREGLLPERARRVA